ncbi:MAG: IS701 family transposase [Pseudomonadales bacterium]|nr:IS701 family transposase [Pseudomonadales bacterium]
MAQKVHEVAVAARLQEFFGRIDTHLKDKRKRESFAMYAYGILGDGERKSVEPIAARACGDPGQTNNVHSKLLYFLGRSQWDDRAVRLEAARYALEAVQQREEATTWIIDDTGFLKQGSHSVGVQRQYTGSAGKVTNCQVGVSLAVATSSEQIPVDFELYLPHSWTEDPARRAEAKIPDTVTFKTKTDLALEMIERAARAELPGNIILADSAYGSSAEFRNTIRLLGFDFGVAIQSTLCVVKLDRLDRERAKPASVLELTSKLGRKAFRRMTWRHGSKSKLSSRFCFVRVKTKPSAGLDTADSEPLWLVAEWPDDEDKPTKFLLTTLPRRMSHKQIVRLVKERWRIERMYEDMKGELGLDHFEGRSLPGWHHHVSVVMCCYAFVVAERVRAFPPSAAATRSNRTVRFAA